MLQKIFDGELAENVILEGDYDYCYKTLLCEMKEFYMLIKRLLGWFKEEVKEVKDNLDEGAKSIQWLRSKCDKKSKL